MLQYTTAHPAANSSSCQSLRPRASRWTRSCIFRQQIGPPKIPEKPARFPCNYYRAAIHRKQANRYEGGLYMLYGPSKFEPIPLLSPEVHTQGRTPKVCRGRHGDSTPIVHCAQPSLQSVLRTRQRQMMALVSKNMGTPQIPSSISAQV